MVIMKMVTILYSELVVDLALLCSFQKMRNHLGVKETNAAQFPADKVAAVAEVLRKSTFLKLSEDGVFSKPFSYKSFNGSSSCPLRFSKCTCNILVQIRILVMVVNLIENAFCLDA